MRAVTYSRVSTSDKGQNPDVQATALREFCTARGWQVTAELVDHGFSGGTDKRPGLVQLLKLVRSRQVDAVVVTKLDRMFRSLKHMVGLIDEFEALGVKFISLGDQIDLSTPSGRLLIHLLAAFSEFERSLIRERTRAGLAYARSKGVKLGRPKERDDEKIRALRGAGHSIRDIAKLTGVSTMAVQRALKP